MISTNTVGAIGSVRLRIDNHDRTVMQSMAIAVELAAMGERSPGVYIWKRSLGSIESGKLVDVVIRS